MLTSAAGFLSSHKNPLRSADTGYDLPFPCHHPFVSHCGPPPGPPDPHAVAKGDTVMSLADAFVDSAHPDHNYGGCGCAGRFGSWLAKRRVRQLSSLLTSAPSTRPTAPGTGSLSPSPCSSTRDFPANGIFNSQAAGQFTIEWIPNNSWVEGTGRPNRLDTTLRKSISTITLTISPAPNRWAPSASMAAPTVSLPTRSRDPDFTAAVQSWRHREPLRHRRRYGHQLSLQLKG